MLYAIRKSDNKEFPVWKYLNNSTFAEEPHIYVWCDEIGKVLIGEDYELIFKKIELK